MMQKICFIMIGVSGAGKSTAQKALASKHAANATSRVFSLDNCRVDYFHQSPAFTGQTVSEAETYAAAFELVSAEPESFSNFVTKCWNSALKEAEVLFVDNTNLTKKSRARWSQEARQKGFLVCAVEVHVPLQVAIDRQLSRGDKSVPEDVVRDMYLRQQSVLLGAEADLLLYYDGTGQNLYSMTLDFA